MNFKHPRKSDPASRELARRYAGNPHKRVKDERPAKRKSWLAVSCLVHGKQVPKTPYKEVRVNMSSARKNTPIRLARQGGLGCPFNHED